MRRCALASIGNRSGYLDYSELRNALRHYGIDANVLQSAEIVRRNDDRPDGKLELAEFNELIKDLQQGVIRSETASRSPYAPNVPARVATAFEEHDANRSGFIDYVELRGALRRYGIDASEGEAASIVRAYDDRPDGKLDVVEFARLVRDIEAGMMRREGGQRGGLASPSFHLTHIVKVNEGNEEVCGKCILFFYACNTTPRKRSFPRRTLTTW